MSWAAPSPKARYGEPPGPRDHHPAGKTDDGKITIGGLDANVWMTNYGLTSTTDSRRKDSGAKLGFARAIW